MFRSDRFTGPGAILKAGQIRSEVDDAVGGDITDWVLGKTGGGRNRREGRRGRNEGGGLPPVFLDIIMHEEIEDFRIFIGIDMDGDVGCAEVEMGQGNWEAAVVMFKMPVNLGIETVAIVIDRKISGLPQDLSSGSPIQRPVHVRVAAGGSKVGILLQRRQGVGDDVLGVGVKILIGAACGFHSLPVVAHEKLCARPRLEVMTEVGDADEDVVVRFDDVIVVLRQSELKCLGYNMPFPGMP